MLAAFCSPAWTQSRTSSSPAPLPSSAGTDAVDQVKHNAADQAFVKAVLERDLADLQLCQLAQSKSQSEDVKSLAQQITGTRTSLDNQVKTIAKQIDVGVPKNPNKKDKQAIAKIEALSGTDFDQQFLQMVGKSHSQDVKDFQSEAANAQEPLVKQVAQPDADVLSKQLAGHPAGGAGAQRHAGVNDEEGKLLEEIGLVAVKRGGALNLIRRAWGRASYTVEHRRQCL